MRKIIAIVLAMLMLFSVAAFAEEPAGTAAAITVGNIELEAGGQKVALGDVTATLALDSIGGAASIIGLVDGGNEALLTAVGQISDRFVFTIDGLDCAYGAELPQQVAEQVGSLGAMLPYMLPALDQIVLPPIPGITIPKLDLTGVLAPFITNDGGSSVDFEIPAEQIDALLDQLISAINSSGIQNDDVSQVLSVIQQLKDSGMGIAIVGSIADNASSQAVSADIYIASNGQMSDASVANLNISTYENHFELVVSAAIGEDMSPVATATLVSDPATAELNLDVDLAGMITLAFSLFPEDGLQKIAFDANAMGEKLGLEFGYGTQNGDDVVAFSGSVPGVSVGFAFVTKMGSDGVRTGTVSFSADQGGETIAFSGDISMCTGADLGLADFQMPADVRDFDQMDQAALDEVLQPMIEYIGGNATISDAA